MTGRGGSDLPNIVAVKLDPAGRNLELDAGALHLARGELVVVQLQPEGQGQNNDGWGPEVATVSVPSARRAAHGPLGRVLRRADARDRELLEANRRRAGEALAYARERARAQQLAIKVFRVELSDGSGRATFYFSSETRVDFRALVKDLASRYRTRIEMRQVGVRDEAKAVGGIGSCGRELCCTTFLPHFSPVSIKMAKHQNLVLNPTRVSGQCGRLKCCLVYEEAAYVEAAKHLPSIAHRVETPDGIGRVGDLDVLAGKVRVYFEDRPPRVFPAAEIRPLGPPPGNGGSGSTEDPPPSVPRE